MMNGCSVCKKEQTSHFSLCEACMEQICHLDARRYTWYQNAIRGALFPPREVQPLPLSLPPVNFPAILEPESCLFNISES